MDEELVKRVYDQNPEDSDEVAEIKTQMRLLYQAHDLLLQNHQILFNQDLVEARDRIRKVWEELNQQLPKPL